MVTPGGEALDEAYVPFFGAFDAADVRPPERQSSRGALAQDGGSVREVISYCG